MKNWQYWSLCMFLSLILWNQTHDKYYLVITMIAAVFSLLLTLFEDDK